MIVSANCGSQNYPCQIRVADLRRGCAEASDHVSARSHYQGNRTNSDASTSMSFETLAFVWFFCM